MLTNCADIIDATIPMLNIDAQNTAATMLNAM